MKHTYHVFAAAIIFSACNTSSDNGVTMPEISSSFAQQIDTSRPASLIPDSVLPSQPSLGGNVAGGGALNPAHGQPGHRCDLAVGAPLNQAAPKQNTSQPINSTPVTNTPAITPVSNAANNNPASSGKLNPAHGQPGHRCDIAVGQPLDAPAKTTVATNNPANPAPVNLLPQQPAENKPTSPFPTTGNVKLNPAHGQPGHDCTIAVGQPLKNQN